MGETLKPCPFCDGTPYLRKNPDMDGFGCFYLYECRSCGASSREKFARETCGNFFAELRDLWNTRSGDLIPRDEITPQMAADWRPIETAPKDGTVILACAEGWSGASLVRWNYTAWQGMCDGGPSILSQTDCSTDYHEPFVTHWMPLPEPPALTAIKESKDE